MVNPHIGAKEAGFGLPEALVATFITAVGVLGVATLIALGARMQLNSRDATNMTSLALARLERLRMLPGNSPERANGGSLTANVANYFTVMQGSTVRWQVQDGPACGPVTWSGTTAVTECSKQVVIVAIPTNSQSATARLEVLLWR